MSALFQLENRAGEIISHGDLRIVPFSQALVVRLPGFPAGVVWNRPTAVWVRTPDGNEQTLPIHDETLLAMLRWFGLAAVFGALVWLLRRLFA